MSGVEKNWYVLRAIGGKEKKAKENIEAEVKTRGLEDLVGQCVVPVEKVVQQRNGKKVVKENVLFSGYVFVECALTTEVQGFLVNVPNVINFVEKEVIESKTTKSKDGKEKEVKTIVMKPWQLRPSEVARMIGQVDEVSDETQDAADVPFVVGDSVKVTDGPFNGFSGVVEGVDEEKKKLSVMVKIFGRNTPLELGYFQVEKDVAPSY